MPNLCRVHGAVISPEHIPLVGATVQFSILPNAVQPSRNGVDTLAPKIVEARTDSIGYVSIDLEPGLYQVTIAAPQRRPYSPYRISVPDAESALLADIQALPAPAPAYMDEVRDALRAAKVVEEQTEVVSELVVVATEAKDTSVDISQNVQQVFRDVTAERQTAQEAAQEAVRAEESGLSTLEQVWALRNEAAEQAAEVRAQVGSTPEHFGAAGDGFTDDTDALIAWMESGGKMTANGTYLVQGRGPDTGGAYARLLRDVDFQQGPNCRFVAGLGLDNDVLRYTLPVDVYLSGKRPSIAWRGGVIDQTLQCNSTVIPNSDFYPPIRPGASVTTDGLYVIGWVEIGGVYHAGLDRVVVEGVKFVSGDHWQTAGGDSQLFISGARTVKVSGNEFVAARDCGFYGSGLPEGVLDGATFEVTANVFRACNWGASVKRNPGRVVMTGNRGLNTPQMLVLSGLTGSEGAGSIIAHNISDGAWQVVRIDDVSGADVFSNVSLNHGPLLADGSTPTAVYEAYNCVVRMQGCTDCRVHDNTLVSINPRAAGTLRTVVHMNRGQFVPATTNCDVYNNRAFVGTSVVEERTDEADWNRFRDNIAPPSVITPVIVKGEHSADADAITHWSSNTTTITGTTEAASLREATVRSMRLRKSGDRVSFGATGVVSGTAGGKRIYALVGGTSYLLGTLTGECEWTLEGTATFTGGASVRTAIRLSTSTGQTFSRAGTAGITAGASWPIAVRGQLLNAADTITCTSMRID